ncbi:MAG: hypothetical protein ASARMPREDX12_007178 [Alectoria sarmentosa]|nr:MAG: hypothetical protein ASARMPREDX12_007178 [Alectoria sarmentosa]
MTNHAAIVPSPKAQLEVITRPIPTPAPHQILIRTRALATNPVDWKIQEHDLMIKTYPTILGTDVAGTVEEVGASVTHFQKGDRVAAFAMFLSQMDEAGFQEYVLANAGCSAKIPDCMSFEEGSLLPMAVATSGVAIFANLGVPTTSGGGQKGGFLVWSGASSVGSGAVQIAAAMGYDVFTVASPRHHAYVKTLGAKFVFDYNNPDVVSEIVAAAKEAGTELKLAYDAISENGTAATCVQVLQQFGGGKLCLTLSTPEETEPPDKVEVSRTMAMRIGTDWKEGGTWLFNDWLEKALVDGSYKPSPGIQVVEGGLAGVQKALDLHRKGVSGKKLVVPLE